MKFFLHCFTVSLFLCFSGTASAQLFNFVRIGDIDGFGYGDASGNGPTGNPYVNDLGTDPDRNNNGILDNGDLLPDLNEDGTVALNSGDDFDNRNSEGVFIGDSAAFYTENSIGELYTDVSLSKSYDSSSVAGTIWDYNTGTSGVGNGFPDGDSNTLPNQPGFLFDFVIHQVSISTNQDIFFNMVFADYDVNPANIKFTFAGGATRTSSVARQGGGEDGLIQSAFASLSFNEVFTAVGPYYKGYLKVDFEAPNEPYTAFDYVELSTAQIAIPEPATVSILSFIGLGIFLLYRRRKCQTDIKS